MSLIQIPQEDHPVYISLETSRTTGFRKWADVHQPMSDQPPARTTPQGADHAVMTLPEQPYRPWVIPGVGTAF